MDLLEKAKEIIDNSNRGYYDNISYLEIVKYSPDICHALLGAMEEIERDQLKSGNWDTQNGMLEALEILRKHLGVEK